MRNNFIKHAFRHTAFKIALIYTIFSVLWILFSDQILYLSVKNVETLTRIQMIKGWVFVLTTACIIFLLLQKEVRKYQQTEKALRDGEARYRFLVENAPLGIISIDQTGAILDANPKLAEIMGSPGVEQTRGINIFSFNPLIESGISGHFRQCLETGEPGVFETKYVSKWGKKVFLRYHLQAIKNKAGHVTGVQGIVEDITVPARLEEELRQAQKMEAMGTLAGGIAHDFNNILSAIIGYTELAQMDIERDNPAQTSLRLVIQSSIRAKNLVEQILTFSRKRQRERKPVKLEVLVEEALQLLRATLPTTIEIRKNIDSGGQLVLADTTMIHQVLINLCSNAADAMRVTGGILSISLDEHVQGGDTDSQYTNLSPGRYRILSVSDTGPGIDKDEIDRIFEPFYTTKDQGKGTGMGLAVVHGIVKSHGGIIQVSSKLGSGTRFDVLLPIVEGDEDLEPVSSTTLSKGHESILFVDDEPSLVEIGKRMLERLGYRVETYTDSREALKAVSAGEGHYDLVVTDQTMPNMTGAELAQSIMRLRPDMPVILCTGYSDTVTAEQARAIGIKAFLMKPLILQDFASAIRQVLDNS
jgi:two-component system cell cycle sensor histidine kinase/response regulator CckA